MQKITEKHTLYCIVRIFNSLLFLTNFQYRKYHSKASQEEYVSPKFGDQMFFIMRGLPPSIKDFITISMKQYTIYKPACEVKLSLSHFCVSHAGCSSIEVKFITHVCSSHTLCSSYVKHAPYMDRHCLCHGIWKLCLWCYVGYVIYV